MKAFETSTGSKQAIRYSICNQAELTLGKDNIKKIFTLPSREALCYYVFKERFPKASIACIEREKEIVEHLHSKDIECLHTDIKNYSKERTVLERHHDIVFLDYYSFLSTNILSEIKAFISNDNIIHKGKPSLVGITLMKGMRKGKEDTLDLLSDYRWEGYRTGTENNIGDVTEGILGFLDLELDIHNIEVLESIEYKAQEQSTPMYFILLKITK
jgi:hypothetical protein